MPHQHNGMEIENGNQNDYFYYVKKAEEMKYNKNYTLEVDFSHIKEWSSQNDYDLGI